MSWEGYQDGDAEIEAAGLDPQDWKAKLLAQRTIWSRIIGAGDDGVPVSECDQSALDVMTCYGRAYIVGGRVYWRKPE